MSILIRTKPTWSNKGRTGPTYGYRQLEWFACEGMIVMMDNRPTTADGERTTVHTADDFATRAYYFSRMASARPQIKYQWQRQKLQEILGAVNDIQSAVQDAKRMGDPDDPAVQSWWQRHYRNGSPRKQPGTETDAAGYRDALREIDNDLRELGINPDAMPTTRLPTRKKLKL